MLVPSLRVSRQASRVVVQPPAKQPSLVSDNVMMWPILLEREYVVVRNISC